MNKQKNAATLYCTEREYRAIRDGAAKEDVSVSVYLRRQLQRLSYGKSAPPEWLGEAVVELRKIGNLLNQIAAVANSTGKIDAENYADNVRKLFLQIEKLERQSALPGGSKPDQRRENDKQFG